VSSSLAVGIDQPPWSMRCTNPATGGGWPLPTTETSQTRDADGAEGTGREGRWLLPDERSVAASGGEMAARQRAGYPNHRRDGGRTGGTRPRR